MTAGPRIISQVTLSLASRQARKRKKRGRKKSDRGKDPKGGRGMGDCPGTVSKLVVQNGTALRATLARTFFTQQQDNVLPQQRAPMSKAEAMETEAGQPTTEVGEASSRSGRYTILRPTLGPVSRWTKTWETPPGRCCCSTILRPALGPISRWTKTWETLAHPLSPVLSAAPRSGGAEAPLVNRPPGGPRS